MKMNQSIRDGRLPVEHCAITRWDPSWSSTITSTTISGITSPVAILLNLLVIIAVAKKKQLRSTYNVLLASMAVADLLIGGVAQPLFITAGILRLQNAHETMCSFVLAGLFVMHIQGASVYHLTLIAWERHVAIKKSISYKFIVTRSRIKISIIIAWVSTALSIIPSVFYVTGHAGKIPWAIASACVFTIPLTICLAATLYFYITIYLEHRKKNKKRLNPLNATQLARANLEKEIARTAFMLTVSLLVSFAPTCVLIFLRYLFAIFKRDAFLWCVTLNQLNSFVSPILYFYRKRRFRNIVLHMLNINKLPTIPISPKGAKKNTKVNEHNLQEKASNGKQCKRCKSNSWGPAMFTEKQDKLSVPRPKSAPMGQTNVATPNKEVTPLYQAKRCLWTRRDFETGADQLGEQLCPIDT